MKNNLGVTIRNAIKPGDMGYLTYLHGKLYADQYGFDHTFEPYVAIPLAQFITSTCSKERIWIVEKDQIIMGSVALVRHTDEQAQLRWLLLKPEIRGLGIGKKLVEEVIAFSIKCGYSSLFLLTIDILLEAADLYRSCGFKVTEETKVQVWGLKVTEQKYELNLGSYSAGFSG